MVILGCPQFKALFRKAARVATSIVDSHASLLSNMNTALQASLSLKDVRCELNVKRNAWKISSRNPPPTPFFKHLI